MPGTVLRILHVITTQGNDIITITHFTDELTSALR